MKRILALVLAFAAVLSPAALTGTASAATRLPERTSVSAASAAYGFDAQKNLLPAYDPSAKGADTASKDYAVLMNNLAAQLRKYDGSNASGFTVTITNPFSLTGQERYDYFDTLFLHTIREYPEFFWVDLGSRRQSYNQQTKAVTYHVTVFPEFQGAGFAAAQEAFTEAVDSVVSEIFHPGMSDMEKVLSAFSWIKQYVKYDSEMDWDAYSAYSALVNRSAVCHGCAVTMNLLLQKAGIGCYTVLSHVENDSVYHVWNAVNVSGHWYNLDPTAGHIPGYQGYGKFMRSTEEMLGGGNYVEHVTRMHVTCDTSYQGDTPWNMTSCSFLYSEKYQALVNVENYINVDGTVYLADSATYRKISIDEDGTVKSTPIATIPACIRSCTQEYDGYLYYLTYDGKAGAYCLSTGKTQSISQKTYKDSYLYLDTREEVLVIADNMGTVKETLTLLG